ncbi:hypothetical protein LEP1GSC021_0729 [Leptospira noguchii str. 1993005606]|nr:hypothetical protein LEP1GSC021_0729 [Leptospira noguchii str. 1993005606]
MIEAFLYHKIILLQVKRFLLWEFSQIKILQLIPIYVGTTTFKKSL